MKSNFKSDYSFKDISGIKTPNHLLYILGEDREKIERVLENKANFYNPFFLQQGDKQRWIDKPIGKLRDIQVKIKDRILCLYKLPGFIKGGVTGEDIKTNAQEHLKQPVVVRMDLSSCFHSIDNEMVFYSYRKNFDYSVSVSRIITALCTYQNHIPVGSPLSTLLVNIALKEIWIEVFNFCQNNNHVFTVWVDDLIISGSSADKLIPEIRDMINNHNLKINWKKLHIKRHHKSNQEVTGLNVNQCPSLPLKKKQKYSNLIKDENADERKIQGSLAHASYINFNQAKQLKKLASVIDNQKS